MPQLGGINGVAVALAAAGSTLVYAGLRHVSPLDALREIASGRGPGPVSTGGSRAAAAVAAGYTGSATAAEHGAQLGAGGGIGFQLAKAAQAYVGRPYVTGAAGPSAFDCSGLVQRAFRDIGITDCPRTSAMQYLWRKLAPISEWDSSAPQAGDLAFWPGHVVILTGPATFVGAQNPRRGVTTGQLSTAGPPGVAMLGIRRYHG